MSATRIEATVGRELRPWLVADADGDLVACSMLGGPATLYVRLSESLDQNVRRLVPLSPSLLEGEVEEVVKRVLRLRGGGS